MMGWQTGDQRQLFYLFNLERRIPASHLLRRINPIVMEVLADLREKLAPFYSDIGRPSIDPELLIRMLIVGYCYGIRFERRLCEEVELHLAYRWFCRLDLDDKVPDHSTFSVNRHGRFRDSNILRHVFEAVVRRREPAVEAVFQALARIGSPRLTGSGSACFVEFGDRASAQDGLAALPPELHAWMAPGAARSPLHAAVESWSAVASGGSA